MYLLKENIHKTTMKKKKQKIHLSDREIHTIRTVIVATFLGIK